MALLIYTLTNTFARISYISFILFFSFRDWFPLILLGTGMVTAMGRGQGEVEGLGGGVPCYLAHPPNNNNSNSSLEWDHCHLLYQEALWAMPMAVVVVVILMTTTTTTTTVTTAVVLLMVGVVGGVTSVAAQSPLSAHSPYATPPLPYDKRCKHMWRHSMWNMPRCG